MKFIATEKFSERGLFWARLFLISLTALSCGLGPTLVQLLGWATMIPTELSKTGSVTQAIENTFDGEHPCKFCKLAEELETVESTSPSEEELPLVPSKPNEKQVTLFIQSDLSNQFFLTRRTLMLQARLFLPPPEVNLDVDSPPPWLSPIFG